jgi:hypothetical protein
MGTTTNNGWPTPVASDLVKDGWEAIKDLGDAIDTTLGVYTASATGLTKLSSASFTSVSSVSLPTDTFTTTYDNYRVMFFAVGGDVNFNIRLRSAGSDNTTSNYWWAGYYIGYGGSPSVIARSGGGASNLTEIGGLSSGAGAYIIDIFNPKTSTTYTNMNFISAESYSRMVSSQFRANTSFDSCSFLPASGTITGSYTVYGYNK